jgi:hypothetical protein
VQVPVPAKQWLGQGARAQAFALARSLAFGKQNQKPYPARKNGTAQPTEGTIKPFQLFFIFFLEPS